MRKEQSADIVHLFENKDTHHKKVHAMLAHRQSVIFNFPNDVVCIACYPNTIVLITIQYRCWGQVYKSIKDWVLLLLLIGRNTIISIIYY